MRCNRDLDFYPRRPWPAALPAVAWQGRLLCGFDRGSGEAVEVGEVESTSFLDTLKACHPELGLGEIARLHARMQAVMPERLRELGPELFASYGLRLSDRLVQTLEILSATPVEFQELVDEKKWGTRDLAPLLALPHPRELDVFLRALPELALSKSDAAKALELTVELFLMGRPLNDLLPSSSDGASHLRRLELWRRPRACAVDEDWRQQVSKWPWPAHVQGQWQRFGDQSGLEIKIRTTSPQDFNKKLERLLSIRDTWSCES